MEIITSPENQNIELGKVAWLRDFDKARQESREKGRPIMMFFQEVPGCLTCVNYGKEVLSNPLMVDFIENEFIPVAIYNNKLGKDAEILKRYSEPSWNNPVTRFVNEKGEDLIQRLADNYHPLGLYNKLIEVLTSFGRPIPKYAELLGQDLRIKYGYATQTIYETPCFWSGETSMAEHPAVLSTNAGRIKHKEVVEVYFDPEKINEDELNVYASQQGFFLIEKEEYSLFKKDEDAQYYLGKSEFKNIQLSSSQRTRINYAIPYGQNPELFLSPTQSMQLNELRRTKMNLNK